MPADRPARRRRAALLGACLVAGATPSGAAAAAQASLPPGAVPLSNLHGTSRWAYPTGEAIVRAAPSPAASGRGRLRLLTGDGQAQLYLVLAATQPGGRGGWLRIELPGRPNGRTGWVPRGALGALHGVDEYLRVDRSSLRATLYRNGRVIFSAPVAVGKPSTVTPAGSFYVVEKLITVHAPAYGPYAIGTSAYAPTLSEWPGGGVVGIHGTNEPQLVPGRPSHGCIRMRNADISRLWRLIEIGTPIDIV